MYSREETQELKKAFWIAFSEKYPRKWLLYNTKIKDFSFKFYVDNKKAQVIIDIEIKDDIKRIAYYEKLISLKEIIENEFQLELIYEKNHYLQNGKIISRAWIEKFGISLNNKDYWNEIFDFFYDKMNALELFYEQYDEYIKDI